MLSVKKEKLHGMKDARWTTEDKLTQFKGLINLYKRDRTITDRDTAVEQRRQVKEIKALKKEIKKNRGSLENAIVGDRQQLRNSLAAHKDMQLAYQYLHPLEVINHIHQDNFTSRKKFDLLTYEMQQNARILCNLKLKQSVLEDQIKYESFLEFPTEKICQIVTGKVQDAILRKEAALVVKQTYTNIISILKKDAMYYDAVLASIFQDGTYQGRCFLNATQMGQLATEYLDDRKREFKILEKCVKRDMKTRMNLLNVVRGDAERNNKMIKGLIRRDDDINNGKVKIPLSAIDVQQQTNIKNFEDLLEKLKDLTRVMDVEKIYPCMQEQVEQKNRLKQFAEKAEEGRDSLLNRLNHAKVMKNQLLYTMIDTTFEYKQEKKRIKDEITEQNERKKRLSEAIQRVNTLLAKIDYCVNNLNEVCKIVATKATLSDTDFSQIISRKPMQHIKENIPEYSIEDVVGTVSNLITLVTKLGPETTIRKEYEFQALHYFENLILDQSKVVPTTGDQQEMETDEFADITDMHLQAHIPTREEIKKQSAFIVKENSVGDDFMVAAPMKKKGKF